MSARLQLVQIAPKGVDRDAESLDQLLNACPLVLQDVLLHFVQSRRLHTESTSEHKYNIKMMCASIVR